MKRNRRDNTSLSQKHRYATRARVHRYDALTFNKPNLGLGILAEIEDRRRWRPEPIHARPVVTITVGQPARLTLKQPRYNLPAQTKARIAFAEPHRLALCIRRHERKRVLHALGKTGAGQKRQRAPRKNQWSEISC